MHLFVNIHVHVPTVLVCMSTSCIPGTRLSVVNAPSVLVYVYIRCTSLVADCRRYTWY